MLGETVEALAYQSERAARYDEESQFDKGNRQQHYLTLLDLLRYTRNRRFDFCDMGCGTGYFASAFFEVAPESQGLAIDVSPAMLDLARQRVEKHGASMEFVCRGFEDFDWQAVAQKFDVVFSAMAIHHLEDAEKWELFRNIFTAVRPNGWFVLYDIVCCSTAQDTELLEYLACADMQRRLLHHLETDFVPEDLRIEQLIANDRRIRANEGDQESSLERQVNALKQAGFNSVMLAFQ